MTRRHRLLIALPLFLLFVTTTSISAQSQETDWSKIRASIKGEGTYECTYDGSRLPPDVVPFQMTLTDGRITARFSGDTPGQVTGTITSSGSASGQFVNAWGPFSWDGNFTRDGERIRVTGAFREPRTFDEKTVCTGSWKGEGAEISQPFKMKLTTAIPKLKQFAPGMDGEFEVQITYSGAEELRGGTLRVTPAGKLLSLLYVPGGESFPEELVLELPRMIPGQPVILGDKVLFRAGTEDVAEIFEQVIKAQGGSISFDQALEVRIEIRDDANEKVEYKVDPEIVYSDGTKPQIQYPNFANLVGTAGPVFAGQMVSAAEASYNLQGDPGWSSMNDPVVRKLAIRAARYDENLLKEKEFPDSARKVAYNIKKYIYRLLNPKSDRRGASIRDDAGIAARASIGGLAPQNPTEQLNIDDGFVCIEHAFLMTSWLRTLGIPAKEANAILTDGTIGRTKRYQTAAAMAWVDAAGGGFRWQYLDPYMDIDSPSDYGSKYTAYAWYGIQSAPSKTFPVTYYVTTARLSVSIPFTSETMNDGNRFTIPDVQMDGWLFNTQSPLWKRLYPVDSAPNVSPAATTITVHSPVRLAYRDSSGRTTGAINGSEVNEIPGAEFFPKGMSVFINAMVPPITIDEDVIVLPSNVASDTWQGRLLLTGTGSGPFTIDVQQHAGGESRVIGSQQGTVTLGQVIDYGIQVATATTGAMAVLTNAADGAPRPPVSPPPPPPVTVDFDRWTFDERSGVVVANAARPERGGVLVNGPAWAAGKTAGALRFNGVDGFVNVPAAIPSPGREGTIAFWFSLPAELSGITSLHQTAIEGLAADGPEGGHLVVGFNQSSVFSGSYAMEFGIHDGRNWSHIKSSTEQWAANTWYHVAVSWGSSGMKIYINGVLESANSDPRVPAAFGSNFRIGQNSFFKANGQGGSWNGFIDDVRVYGTTMSDIEIRTIYAQP